MNEKIIKEYSEAIFNSQMGCYESLNRFKEEHGEEYKLITSMYRKRVSINNSYEAYEKLGFRCYWFTLTFNNEKNDNLELSRRREAMRFLNGITKHYLMVEEYGEDNSRYHIHGFMFLQVLPFEEDRDIKQMFYKWHSIEDIKRINSKGFKTKKRYLTNYNVKSNPRIRRSRACASITNKYKFYKSLFNSFPTLALAQYNEVVSPLL